MTVRVLVVDDSGFFRRRVTEMLNADPALEVIDAAENGKIAIEKALELKPDVITMDIEMPVMDGITAVREIMAKRPTPIVMFSSLTTDGAKATLDALDAGAVDFLPKRFEDISKDRDEAKRVLCERVRDVGRKRAVRAAPVTTAARPRTISRPATSVVTPSRSKGDIKLVAIGTSTGGPVALQQVLTVLPANFPVPILLVQHMPGTFTPAFAKRLDQLCAINIRHTEDGDELVPGTAFLAPGGRQMMVEKSTAGKSVLRIKDSEPGQTFHPSVDTTFESVSRVFPNSTLAIILTGMGADGCKGAQQLKQKGSLVWAQDEATSVVYGMPAAVAEAGITERILGLNDIGPTLAQRV